MAFAKRNQQVAEGQVYRRIGVATGLWRVEMVRRDVTGHFHVQLRSLEDPTAYKTISALVLADGREYELVERAVSQAGDRQAAR